MTKTHRKAASSAEDAFHRHYAAIWGEERWQNSLYQALLQPTRYACVLNRYTPLTKSAEVIKDESVDIRALDLPFYNDDMVPNVFVRYQKADLTQDVKSNVPSDTPFPTPEPSINKLLSHWNLDAASVLVASLMNIQPGHNVLDLCAAPGGKSVALSQRIWPHLHQDPSELKQKTFAKVSTRTGHLHSNEVDGARFKRLAENLKVYMPKIVVDSAQVNAFRVDGAKSNADYGFRVRTNAGTVGYDKVLVDAPCSSERHIIHAQAKASASGRFAEDMANWRPGSSKRLAATQIDLLMTGLKAATTDGTVIYATCSIEPTENDNVVEKVLAQVEKERKKGSKWNVKVGLNAGNGDKALEEELEKHWAEKTKYGWIVLPDHPSAERWGPLFFAVLTKGFD
ncbi:Multisite-specific tRNA:(cytosine-C(5))-methyltransferase trm4b [Lecanosticta acicola]|uniref:NOL1/NOP2/Sun domain family member 4 n=1 Tax=Lecanosticta acicola TaxID=111012 RepID=A0AAI8YX19_9PEZI|nr:Multisite-specific tRNA:(cytosine-C(5))-methyltransferase trm4b [Lecanosticta acicola]